MCYLQAIAQLNCGLESLGTWTLNYKITFGVWSSNSFLKLISMIKTR